MKPSMDNHAKGSSANCNACQESSIKNHENCCQEIIDIFSLDVCKENVTVQRMNQFAKNCLLRQTSQDTYLKPEGKTIGSNYQSHERTRPPNPVAKGCLMKQSADVFEDQLHENLHYVPNFKPISSALETGWLQTSVPNIGDQELYEPMHRTGFRPISLFAETGAVQSTNLLNNCNNHVYETVPQPVFTFNPKEQSGLLNHTDDGSKLNKDRSCKKNTCPRESDHCQSPPARTKPASDKINISAGSKVDKLKDCQEKMKASDIDNTSKIMLKICEHILLNPNNLVSSSMVDNEDAIPSTLKGMAKRASKFLEYIFDVGKQNTAIVSDECAEENAHL